MVKTTKSAAPVPTNENNVESVKKTTTEKTKKVPTEKKVKTSKVVEPEVVEPTVVVAEDPLLVSDAVVVSCDSTVVDNTASLNDMPCKIADFNNKYNQVVAMLSLLKQSFKAIEKSAQRDWRVAQKALAKKNKKAEKRPPSGFVRPCLISDEMAAFLEVDVGTMIARTSVSKLINTYIRNNNLQDKTHGRNINPDEKLSKLLNIVPNSTETLTYFNLQRYMKHHFIKTSPVAVESL